MGTNKYTFVLPVAFQDSSNSTFQSSFILNTQQGFIQKHDTKPGSHSIFKNNKRAGGGGTNATVAGGISAVYIIMMLG
jgi:hypothetical protein